MDEIEWKVTQLPTVMPPERKARLKPKRKKGRGGKLGTATIKDRGRHGRTGKVPQARRAG